MKDQAQDFQNQTIDYLANTDLGYRRKYGQYFTPLSVRNLLFEKLKKFEKSKILDPSCGSGEFLLSAQKFFPKAIFVGWEKDKNLTKIARQIVPDAEIKNVDSLYETLTPKYDLVIGNPPYFEFKPDNEIKDKFSEVIKGRTNIFSFFIKLGLDLLEDNGHLAFVVPPSMNNGAFFNKLRQYIISQGKIEYLKILNSPKLFDQAQQSVMLIIIRKGKKSSKYIFQRSSKYIFQRNGLTLFSPKATALKRYFINESTLFELGYRVKTGPIVWNEKREYLTNSDKNSTLLIWGHNIKPGRIELSQNPVKMQYIRNDSFFVGPAILVNRITGTSGSSRIKAALIEKGNKFLAENHVNIIFPPKDRPKSELISLVRQLNSDDISEKLNLITGNTQLSKNELEKILPLKFK